MAGRARTNALKDELAKRASSAFDPDDDEPTPTALDYVCYRIETRTTVKALAKELAEATSYPIDDAMLSRFLRAQYGDENTDHALDAARARASHGYAEESIEILDGYAADSTDVSRAQSRARGRQWLAERWNSAKYGNQKGVSVSVSIGSLHLDALRSVNVRTVPIVTVTESHTPLLAAGADE